MNMNVVVHTSGGEARVSISVDGKTVGVLSTTHADAVEIAKRLGDDTPAAIRDRCYSLVQALAKRRPLDGSADMRDWLTEVDTDACSIAHDAGWT